jgi:hypothetical protein
MIVPTTAGRWQRLHHPHGGQEARGDAGLDDRGREQARGQRHHRHRVRGQGRARRLHHPVQRPADRAGGRPLQQAALRPDQGLHADHRHHPHAAVVCGEHDQGAGKVDQGVLGAGQAQDTGRQLWLHRPGLVAPPVHAQPQRGRRPEHDPRALQGGCPCGAGRGRRRGVGRDAGPGEPQAPCGHRQGATAGLDRHAGVHR